MAIPGALCSNCLKTRERENSVLPVLCLASVFLLCI